MSVRKVEKKYILYDSDNIEWELHETKEHAAVALESYINDGCSQDDFILYEAIEVPFKFKLEF